MLRPTFTIDYNAAGDGQLLILFCRSGRLDDVVDSATLDEAEQFGAELIELIKAFKPDAFGHSSSD